LTGLGMALSGHGAVWAWRCLRIPATTAQSASRVMCLPGPRTP
jgi:hypothetical protein